MTKLRILVADDHTILRQGLRKILQECAEWEIVGEAGNGREAIQLTLSLKPDVAILDVGMSLLNGIEVTRQILRHAPTTRILILSMHADEAYITEALRAGAFGYLLKDSAATDLIQAVEAVGCGKSFFSPAVARVVLDGYVRDRSDKQPVGRFDSLSPREREVFQLVAEGYTNKQIADLLAISATTVETHRAHILGKLDLHSAAELVRYAIRRGIIS